MDSAYKKIFTLIAVIIALVAVVVAMQYFFPNLGSGIRQPLDTGTRTEGAGEMPEETEGETPPAAQSTPPPAVSSPRIPTPPGPNASQAERDAFSRAIISAQVATSNLQITSGCRLDPSVVTVKLGAPALSFKNQDSIPHQIGIGSANTPIQPQETKTVAISFKEPSFYGLVCDNEVAGILHLSQ